MSTRYVFCIVRTLVSESDKKLDAVHKLQDQIRITVTAPEKAQLNLPSYQTKSLDTTREPLIQLFQTESKDEMFGVEADVNPISHVIGAAGGWGGLPRNRATYESHTVENNDGETEYYIVVPANVPVNGFWSITVYNEVGFFFHRIECSNKNQFNTVREADGSTIIHFSNDKKRKNNINIKKGWNYTVRMYDPQPPILSRKWKFPKATPFVNAGLRLLVG